MGAGVLVAVGVGVYIKRRMEGARERKHVYRMGGAELEGGHRASSHGTSTSTPVRAAWRSELSHLKKSALLALQKSTRVCLNLLLINWIGLVVWVLHVAVGWRGGRSGMLTPTSTSRGS